ncbi:MAG: DUF4831 family protein [Paramuribaculum sp.]|nr:DUF4831 family protein [Paramuribaculum sp.]MDE6651290.1 DUF4831 family protein [Paramuribaculum sp.]
MKKLLLILAVSATTAVSAQTTQKLTASKINEYGLIYNLPVTAVDVTVEAERTVKTPGEFRLYSKKYLNIAPIMEPAEEWTVKSLQMNTRGIADQSEGYLVQFKSGNTTFMMLDDNGCVLSVNDENVAEPIKPTIPAEIAMQPSILQTPVAAQAVTQDMLQATSTAKKAQLAAAKIYELRQSRNDIISGNADQMPSDGEAMKIALENLEKQEAALTAMFTGTVQKSTSVRTYTVVPDSAATSKIVARVSVTEGPVENDDLSGMPIYLNITVNSRGELPKNEKGETKKYPKGGLAYCVPGEATFTAVMNGKTLAKLTAEVAQYGIVFGLEPSIFTDKKAPAYAIFDPATGAIRELGTK